MEQLCVGCFAKPPSYHHRQLSPTSPTVAAVITTTATTTTTTTIISSTSNVATTVTTSLPPPFQPHLPQPPPQPPPHQHHYQHHHPLHHSHHSPHHYHHHHHSSPATTRMKARQFARRFSLQPFSLTREDSSEAPGTSDRIPGVSGPGSGGGPGGGGGGGGVGASCHDRGSASSAGGAVGGPCPGGKTIQDDRKRRYRVVIMGAARVGKTAIINQFLYDTFTPKYTRTVEEMHHGEYEVSGMALTLDILDTSGSYEFPAMRELSINTADAFILVYAINDAESFEEVRNLRDYILKTKQKDVPLVVVGNKNDLEADRAVPYEKAETIVSLDWENGFLETSAKDNLGVLHVFKELLNQAKIRYALSPAVKRRRQSMPNVGGMQITPAQLSHLKHISKRSSSSKRNSCVIA